jgi:hypothetical protein
MQINDLNYEKYIAIHYNLVNYKSSFNERDILDFRLIETNSEKNKILYTILSYCINGYLPNKKNYTIFDLQMIFNNWIDKIKSYKYIFYKYKIKNIDNILLEKMEYKICKYCRIDYSENQLFKNNKEFKTLIDFLIILNIYNIFYSHTLFNNYIYPIITHYNTKDIDTDIGQVIEPIYKIYHKGIFHRSNINRKKLDKHCIHSVKMLISLLLLSIDIIHKYEINKINIDIELLKKEIPKNISSDICNEIFFQLRSLSKKITNSKNLFNLYELLDNECDDVYNKIEQLKNKL